MLHGRQEKETDVREKETDQSNNEQIKEVCKQRIKNEVNKSLKIRKERKARKNREGNERSHDN